MFLINFYWVLFLRLLLILLSCVNVLGMKIHKVKKDKQKQKTINCFVSSTPPGPVAANYSGIRCCIWSERGITYLSKLILNFLSVRPHLNRISTQSCKTRGENKNCSKYQQVSTEQISGELWLRREKKIDRIKINTRLFSSLGKRVWEQSS